MIHAVHHTTTYAYSQVVMISHHVLHLTPRDAPTQTVRGAWLDICPAPAVLTQDIDYFGNPVRFMTLQEQHDRLVVTARMAVEVTPIPSPIPDRTPAWDAVREVLERDLSPGGLEVFQYAFPSRLTEATPAIATYGARSFPPGRPMLDAALDLMARIHADFAYDPRATEVSTPLETVFAQRRGVCQDFAHLQLACLRALGVPARYVSGYILTHPPPGQPKLEGADASHAWLSLWVPGHGWVDLDPTNNLVPGQEHVTLAWGLDFADVSPIAGEITGGGTHEVEVAVDVSPMSDADAVSAVDD